MQDAHLQIHSPHSRFIPRLEAAHLLFVVLLTLLPIGHTLISGEKTDKIGLRNGDRLTCEVKKLESGLLQVSTDDMGTINIEWDKVILLESKEQFEIDMTDGVVHFGAVSNTTTPTLMAITSDTLTVIVARYDVVKLVPIKSTFWERLDGSLSLGVSYTKAGSILQLNTAANIVHRARKRESELDFNAALTHQENAEKTERLDLNFGQTFLFENRWFGIGGIGIQRNRELGLDWRLSVMGGGGNQFVQTNSERFSVGAGLSANKEWVIESGDNYNLEAVVNLAHSKFRYDRPKLNLSTKLSTYGNITHLGRYRMEFSTYLSWEVMSDFIVQLSLYDSFNSDPPADASRNDWNTAFSLGYTF